ncbi:MAG: hypothetical protein JWO32_721 [Bacteroidetes bacterium]|nr:hypothetical protein [Bacteroidota bacterium]
MRVKTVLCFNKPHCTSPESVRRKRDKQNQNVKNILFIFLCLLTVSLHSQTTPPAYNNYIKKADSLYRAKDYKGSSLTYDSAFRVMNNKGLLVDRYNAARSWALADMPDSAFANLEKIIKKRLFVDYDKLINDKDFVALHQEPKWPALIDTLNFHRQNKKSGYDPVPATFWVKNNSKKTIALYWIDRDFKEVLYFNIPPKKTISQQTYIGTVWVLRRELDKSQIIEFSIMKQNQKFDTNGPIPSKW